MPWVLGSCRCAGMIALIVACALGKPDVSRAGEWPTKEDLLSRFDRNGDGRIEGEEKSAVHKAFGGIDVPMLPAKPHAYVHSTIPDYIGASELAKLDNSPSDNPLTGPGATLGRVLFYDKQLSKDNTVACASCHVQKNAFSDPRRVSVGVAGATSRNAMALVNLRYTHVSGERPGFFWDERAATLEAQVLIPIQDKVEMGMELLALEKKLERLPYYPPLFESAFGSPDVKSDRIAKAVAQFMRSLVSFDSKYDRAARSAAKRGDPSGDFPEFSPQENVGRRLFMEGIDGVDEFACAMCHLPPTFGMSAAANNGLDLEYKDAGLGALGRKSNDPFTKNNDGKFKAPSLRNIELTAPYMHDGRFTTLEEVAEHYSEGVRRHPNLSLALPEGEENGPRGLRLSQAQKAALVAFLKTLTDLQFVSEPRFSDPFLRVGK